MYVFPTQIILSLLLILTPAMIVITATYFILWRMKRFPVKKATLILLLSVTAVLIALTAFYVIGLCLAIRSLKP